MLDWKAMARHCEEHPGRTYGVVACLMAITAASLLLLGGDHRLASKGNLYSPDGDSWD